jgi:subtilisin family serine protease
VPNRLPRLAPLAALVIACVAAIPNGPRPIESAYADAPDGRLVVTWHAGSVAPATAATLGVEGVASIQGSHSNPQRSVIVARAGRSDAVAARLRDDPRVESVVPDAIGRVTDWPADAAPNDSLYATNQHDFDVIGMPAAWQLTTGATSVVVAVLDTGYYGAHADLAAIPTVWPRNTRNDTKSVTDGYGHGTHVAGTIAAQTNNAIGVAGMAPNVTIMPVKVMDSNGQGYWSDFLEGVDWARNHGADVINLSLGGTLSLSQAAAWQPVFDAAYQAGVVVVAAAGNNNRNEPFYPASFHHVISVAATTNADLKASFSNFGPAVDIAAPGASITSTYADGGYYSMSGTSMATPHVVGLVALVRAYHPEFTVDEVEQAIELTALDLGAAGRDNYFGYGRIQVDEALAWVPPDVIAPVASLTAPLRGATNVAESARPTVGFTEDVVGADGATISLATGAGIPVDATVTYDAEVHRATVTPAARLWSNTRYVVSVAPGIADLAGNPLPPTSFSFTTGDYIRPTVTWVYPGLGSTGSWLSVSPRLGFSEAVRNVSASTIKLRNLRSGRLIEVVVTYDRTTHSVTINPTRMLRKETWYQIKVRALIEDLSGNNVETRWFRFRTRS